MLEELRGHAKNLEGEVERLDAYLAAIPKLNKRYRVHGTQWPMWGIAPASGGITNWDSEPEYDDSASIDSEEAKAMEKIE